MRCRMTASLRATATVAFRSPVRLASLIPQAFSADHFGTRGQQHAAMVALIFLFAMLFHIASIAALPFNRPEPGGNAVASSA
jgi:hypothetical protein